MCTENMFRLPLDVELWTHWTDTANNIEAGFMHASVKNYICSCYWDLILNYRCEIKDFNEIKMWNILFNELWYFSIKDWDYFTRSLDNWCIKIWNHKLNLNLGFMWNHWKGLRLLLHLLPPPQYCQKLYFMFIDNISTFFRFYISFLKLVIEVIMWTFTDFSMCFLMQGVHPCDKRRSISEYQSLFPAIDFSLAST